MPRIYYNIPVKRIFRALCAILCAAASAMCGCGGGEESEAADYRYSTIYAMNTSALLVVYDDFSAPGAEEKFARFEGEARGIIAEVENSLSVSKEGSSVLAFNGAEAGAKVEIDVHAYEVLSAAERVYADTDGYYNPAVYYNVSAYGFNGGTFPASEEDIPTDGEIAAYGEIYSRFGELTLTVEGDKYYAIKPSVTAEYGGTVYSMKVDLGGIGKGYAADLIDGLMDEYGYGCGYFSFGTSSIALKRFADGGDFTLGFTDPRAPWDEYLSAPVSDRCISTSGDYENYFELGGKRYCHIFSPVTGRPVETGIMSATLIGGSAAENDAYTTAIMAMPPEKAAAFIAEKLSSRLAVFTLSAADGLKYFTNIGEGGYTILNGRYTPYVGAENVA